MSLLLSQLGAVVAPDQLWPTETDLAALQTDSDEIELSFTYGPLSADFVVADDTVYSAALGETPEEEAPEGEFSLSLQDEFIIYGAQGQDELPEDELPVDLEFILTVQDDSIILAGPQDEVPEDEQPEAEFTLSLQDDFVVVADVPYQHFDDYADATDAEYDYSFYIGAIENDVQFACELTSPAYKIGTFQSCAFQQGLGQRQGDDAWVRHTGEARRAIYARQIRDIEERITSQPLPKTAKKRKKRIEALETAIEVFEDAPLPAVYEKLETEIDDFDGSEARYTAIMELFRAYAEQMLAAEQRRARNKRIAIAMLMTA
jgi:hypothetical protein